MKWFKLVFIVEFIMVVSACSSNVSISATNTPEITNIPQPTPTPQPLILANFTGEIEGVGEQGNMACIIYQGNKQDLEGFTITANISQGSNVLDSNVQLETINGEDCFEMVDAKYSVGEATSLIINIAGRPQYSPKEILLGDYHIAPFLGWYFGESNIARIVTFPNPDHPEAYDISGTSMKYPEGKDHPVYSPCKGLAINFGIVTLPERWFHNFWLICEDTGFLVHLGHMESDLSQENEVQVQYGQLLGNLYPDSFFGDGSPFYHTHTNIWLPNQFPYKFPDEGLEEGLVIDIFNPHIQTGGDPLKYGFWLPETLPIQVKEIIDAGTFLPHYDVPSYFVNIY